MEALKKNLFVVIIAVLLAVEVGAYMVFVHAKRDEIKKESDSLKSSKTRLDGKVEQGGELANPEWVAFYEDELKLMMRELKEIAEFLQERDANLEFVPEDRLGSAAALKQNELNVFYADWLRGLVQTPQPSNSLPLFRSLEGGIPAGLNNDTGNTTDCNPDLKLLESNRSMDNAELLAIVKRWNIYNHMAQVLQCNNVSTVRYVNVFVENKAASATEKRRGLDTSAFKQIKFELSFYATAGQIFPVINLLLEPDAAADKSLRPLLLVVDNVYVQGFSVTPERWPDSDTLRVLESEVEAAGGDRAAVRNRLLQEFVKEAVKRAPPLLVEVSGYVMDFEASVVDLNAWVMAADGSGFINPYTGETMSDTDMNNFKNWLKETVKGQ